MTRFMWCAGFVYWAWELRLRIGSRALSGFVMGIWKESKPPPMKIWHYTFGYILLGLYRKCYEGESIEYPDTLSRSEKLANNHHSLKTQHINKNLRN